MYRIQLQEIWQIVFIYGLLHNMGKFDVSSMQIACRTVWRKRHVAETHLMSPSSIIQTRDHVAHYCNCLTILAAQVEIDQETIKYCNDGLFRSASRWPVLMWGKPYQRFTVSEYWNLSGCVRTVWPNCTPVPGTLINHEYCSISPPLSATVLKQCSDSERGAMVTVIVQSSQNEREKVVRYSTITCTADCHLAHFAGNNGTITFCRLQ